MTLNKTNKTASTPEMPVMPDIFGNPNCIQARHHTLFWEEVPATQTPVVAKSENGEEGETLLRTTPAYTMYKLFIGTFDSDISGLHKIINQLHKAENQDFLEMHVASRGGSLEELIELSNAISVMFGTGEDAAINVYINHAYSAGAMISLLGGTRIVYEDSDFMFHSYAGGAYGKRDDMINQLTHGDKQASRFMKRVIQGAGYLTKKEFKSMQRGKDFWMDAKEMLKRNIATHILIDGQLLNKKDYKKYKKELHKKNKNKTK